MHKVSRSLLFASIVALGGLAACGDDVTVAGPGTGTGVVSVSPNPAEIAVNGTVNMVADRSGAAAGQTVTWTTSNAAIATVDAASGVVTGKSNGTVAVTATAGGFSGSATVKVGGSAGGTASVTIASITSGGLQNPVDLNNAQGQIDVTLNIDAAGQTLSKVELVVTDSATGVATVCATQTISASASTAAKAEGVSASVVAAEASVAAQATVTLSCNTAAVAANGAVTFTNGAKSISARVYDGAGALINSASNTVRVRFANESGFIATVVNTPTTPAALRNAEGTAVSTVDGLLYRQGSVKITLTGANFEPGQSANFATVTGTLALVEGAGPSPALTFTRVEGTQNFTATLSATTLATASGTYELDVTGSTTAGGAVGSSHVGGDTEFRIDNVAPVSTGAFEAALVDNFFVNGSYPFAASNTALFTAPTAPADAGVGGTTVKFFAGPAAKVAAITGLPGAITTAKLADLKEITTGDALAATLENDIYGVIAVTTDKLGNNFAQSLAVNFGVDKVAPTGFAFATATPADKAANPAGTYSFKSADFADDASGFGVEPLIVTVTRTDVDDVDLCVAPSADVDDECVASAELPTFALDPASYAGAAGYYTMSTILSDTAGNATSPLVRSFLIDVDAPEVNGGISIPAVIAPGASVSFSQDITDNLDLSYATLSVVYPTMPAGVTGVRADSVQLGTYGADVLSTEATPTLTIGSFIRSFTQVGGASGLASDVRINAVDVGGNQAQNPQALPSANITGTDVDWAAQGIASFTVTNVAKSVKNKSTATGDSTKVNLTAQVVAADLSVNNPFESLVFWYVEPATGELVQIGTATVAVMTNAGGDRIFTYTLTGWDPPAALGTTGTVQLYATGIKGGNALVTAVNTNITLVP